MAINLSEFNVPVYNVNKYQEVGRDMAKTLFGNTLLGAEVYQPKSGANLCLRLDFPGNQARFIDFAEGEVHYIGEMIELDKIGLSALKCEGRNNKLKCHYPASQDWVDSL